MTGSPTLRVIVPMKPAYEGKSRLAPVLDAEGRAALSLYLLQHVLRVVALASVGETWVVGGDQWVRYVAIQESAHWQPDSGGNLNDAIRHAASVAFAAEASAILVLPGDLGFLSPGDVADLLALSNGFRSVVLARAATDGGTNAILAPRGLMVGPSFGPGSFQRHLEEARKAKAPVAVSQAPGLAFDLDTPKDLSDYRAKRPELESELASWREKLRFQPPEVKMGQNLEKKQVPSL